MQRYKKDIFQTNNLPKNDKIQRNNSSKIDKIQGNNQFDLWPATDQMTSTEKGLTSTEVYLVEAVKKLRRFETP